MIKVNNSIWFNEMGSNNPIGIVIGENEVGEEKAYIGTGSGESRMVDENNVAKYGAKYPLIAAKSLMGHNE